MLNFIKNNNTWFLYFGELHRNSVDCKCTYNYSGSGLWSTVTGLGASTAGMALWHCNSFNLLRHIIIYRWSLSRLLQSSRLWQEKLFLWGGCQMLLWQVYIYNKIYIQSHQGKIMLNLILIFLGGLYFIRWKQVQGLWVGPVYTPQWDASRLYHHNINKHGVS